MRLGERHIEAQLRASVEQDAKSRHLMTMAGATLVAAAAIGGLATQSGGWAQTTLILRAPFALALGFSFWFTGRAFGMLAKSYVGAHDAPMEWQIGWHPKNLRRAALDGDTLPIVRDATMRGLVKWARKNDQLLMESYRLRRRAVTLLTFAGGYLVLALIYAVFAF